MYCPQCGQQQVADTIRFCSRCGFPLEGVSSVVASGGQVPRFVPAGKQPLSPRSKGVRQGAMMMLSTILIVPLLAIITTTLNIYPELVVPVAAVTCFVGGLLRLLYALIMEDATPTPETSQPTYQPMPPQL